jgi:hypothetical protein
MDRIGRYLRLSKIQILSEWWRPPVIVMEIAVDMITLAWEM